MFTTPSTQLVLNSPSPPEPYCQQAATNVLEGRTCAYNQNALITPPPTPRKRIVDKQMTLHKVKRREKPRPKKKTAQKKTGHEVMDEAHILQLERKKRTRMRKKEEKRARKKGKLRRENESKLHGQAVNEGSVIWSPKHKREQQPKSPRVHLGQSPVTPSYRCTRDMHAASPWKLSPDVLPQYKTFFSPAHDFAFRQTGPNYSTMTPSNNTSSKKSKKKDSKELTNSPSPEPAFLATHTSLSVLPNVQVETPIDLRTFLPPESLAGPAAAPAVNAAFGFLQAIQHEQSELCKQTEVLETKLRKLRSTVFKLDYTRTKAYEDLLQLMAGFCHELSVREYAFRDVLDEKRHCREFNLGEALEGLQRDVGQLVQAYDKDVSKFYEGFEDGEALRKLLNGTRSR